MVRQQEVPMSLAPPDPGNLVEKSKECGFSCVSLRACALVDQALVDRARALDLSVIVWTVNDPEEAARYLLMGVDGITTDRPGWLREKAGPTD